jgi:hypothetical protein
MQEGVCTSQVLGGKCGEGMSSWQRAKRPTITAFAVLTLASILPYQSTAQISSQAPPAQTQVRHALSPEVLAMHARLKRPVPSVPDLLDSAAAVSSPINFNSEQGPGFGPKGLVYQGAMCFQLPHPQAPKSGCPTLGHPLPPSTRAWSGRFSCSTRASWTPSMGPSPFRCIWAT